MPHQFLKQDKNLSVNTNTHGISIHDTITSKSQFQRQYAVTLQHWLRLVAHTH